MPAVGIDRHTMTPATKWRSLEVFYSVASVCYLAASALCASTRSCSLAKGLLTFFRPTVCGISLLQPVEGSCNVCEMLNISLIVGCEAYELSYFCSISGPGPSLDCLNLAVVCKGAMS